MTEPATRRCPYCAEEIRAEAVECRWCGCLLGGTALSRTWYRSRRGKMIAGVCVGLAAGAPAVSDRHAVRSSRP